MIVFRVITIVSSFYLSVYSSLGIAGNWDYGMGTGADTPVQMDLQASQSGSFIYQDLGQPLTATSLADSQRYTLKKLQVIPPSSFSMVSNSSWWQCPGANNGRMYTYQAGFTILRDGVAIYTGNSEQVGLYHLEYSDAHWAIMELFSLEYGRNNVNYNVALGADASEGYIYASDSGPSGLYSLPGGKQVYAYRDNAKPLVALTMRILASGQCMGTNSENWLPPVDPEMPNIVCNFSTDGDIDLGVVDSSSANNRYSQTYLYSQCTDDAVVTARIKNSDGGNNLLQMGGLSLRVIFDNNSDTKTYSVNTNLDSQIIWGQVTSVGTLTPGKYSQPMIVYLNYE